VFSLALIWERWRFFARSLHGLKPFTDKVRQALGSGNLNEAVAACRAHKGLAAGVVMAALVGPTNREDRKRSALRAAERAAGELTQRVALLGSIASTAPFIGLFGTVIGVMRAFKDLASAAGAGPGVVPIGISEALICTATGLLVAIPAVWAFNYFNGRASRFLEEMGWLSEEILETLSEKAHR
jgi:biopolymer transport protein ExbB/biopolymer transport protein TolQ